MDTVVVFVSGTSARAVAAGLNGLIGRSLTKYDPALKGYVGRAVVGIAVVNPHEVFVILRVVRANKIVPD